jgi:hypothetical protein
MAVPSIAVNPVRELVTASGASGTEFFFIKNVLPALSLRRLFLMKKLIMTNSTYLS